MYLEYQCIRSFVFLESLSCIDNYSWLVKAGRISFHLEITRAKKLLQCLTSPPRRLESESQNREAQEVGLSFGAKWLICYISCQITATTVLAIRQRVLAGIFHSGRLYFFKIKFGFDRLVLMLLNKND